MPSPTDLMLSDLHAKYAAQANHPAFARLYLDDAEFGHMFSILHRKLNQHFEDINDRARTTRHYWAENSRNLLDLIEEINGDLYELKRAGVEVALDSAYQEALERCEPWLSRSGGSEVPKGFEPLPIVKYEKVFDRVTGTVKLEKQPGATLDLKMVGEGSYAHVYSYVDPDYGIKFAVKRAKRGLDSRDLERFKKEFEIMKDLSFPYVVEVYRYDELKNEYRMEYCDSTLRDYVAKRNVGLSFATRKRIALQFLYGINYIHHRAYLHRDISLQNVLLKEFAGGGVVLVKLSDFGLAKHSSSEFTRTGTELRGTIRDPLLEEFKSYDVRNEMYAIGMVLAYIFTGRESFRGARSDVARVLQKCVDLQDDGGRRYATVGDLIADVEALSAVVTDAPA